MTQGPRRAAAFFLLAFGITWSCWITAAIGGRPWTSFPTVILYVLGGMGPSAAGLIMVWRTYDAAARRDFRRRVVDVRLITLRWYGVIVTVGAGPALLGFLLAGVGAAGSGDGAAQSDAGRGWAAPGPAALAAIVAFNLAAAAFEELGWRGYALDALRERLGRLATTLALGGAWLVWHISLYFIEGTFQQQNGFGTAAFWLYSLALLPETTIYLWVYEATGRSIFSALLLHWVVNVSGEVLDLDLRAQSVRLGVTAAIAAAILLLSTDLRSVVV